jgi:hypothetical protein
MRTAIYCTSDSDTWPTRRWWRVSRSTLCLLSWNGLRTLYRNPLYLPRFHIQLQVTFGKFSWLFVLTVTYEQECDYTEVLDQCAVTGLAAGWVGGGYLKLTNALYFTKQDRARLTAYFHPGILRGLFDHKDEGNMFLRNVGWLSVDYTALYPRIQHSSRLQTITIMLNNQWEATIIMGTPDITVSNIYCRTP